MMFRRRHPTPPRRSMAARIERLTADLQNADAKQLPAIARRVARRLWRLARIIERGCDAATLTALDVLSDQVDATIAILQPAAGGEDSEQ